jgi:SAM-dependent methyltransferase
MDNQEAVNQFLLQNLVPDPGTVVDLGCGRGDRLAVIQEHIDWYALGIEVFEDYYEFCTDRGLNVRHQEITNYLFETMPSPIQCVMIDVWEHLTPKAAFKAMDLMKMGQRILIFSPHGECPQEEYHGNPFQKHEQTIWDTDLNEMGFETMVVYDFHEGLPEGASTDVVFAIWDRNHDYNNWSSFCELIANGYRKVSGKTGK